MRYMRKQGHSAFDTNLGGEKIYNEIIIGGYSSRCERALVVKELTLLATLIKTSEALKIYLIYFSWYLKLILTTKFFCIDLFKPT